VARAAFQGLAPLLVQFGVTSPEAEALLRAVCVHETARAHTVGGRRPNVSRVSVKTGVNRHLVKKLLKNPPVVDGGLSSRRDSMRRVIDGWLSDPEYTTRGRPRDLEIGSPSSQGQDTWTLIQRYAPGVWPRLIIDELIRVDYVDSRPNGRLRWKGNARGKWTFKHDAQEAASQRMRDVMRAAFHDGAQTAGLRHWRTAQSTEIAQHDLPLVRKMLGDRLEAIIVWLTEELNSARWRRGTSKGDRMRVGVSGFMFEEPSMSRERGDKAGGRT
jgi:ribosomal protein L31E